MELAEIRPFEPQMAEIDLFTMPDAVGVGEPSVRKVKPYIAGHVTDGSSTFTFKVNGNESVTVLVDANGNWKWVNNGNASLDLSNAFVDITNVDIVIFYGCTITNIYWLAVRAAKLEKVYFKKCKTANCKNANSAFFQTKLNYVEFPSDFKPQDIRGMFYGIKNDLVIPNEIFTNCTNISNTFQTSKIKVVDFSKATLINSYDYTFGEQETINLHHIPANCVFSNNVFPSTLKNLTFVGSVNANMSFALCSVLTEQSVVNLFNAVAADGITLTFHATVYAMIEEQLEIEGSPIYEAYWNSDYDFNYASA